MTLEEAVAWLRSPIAERLLRALDDDADTAIDAAGRLIPQLRQYPAATTADLRRLVTTLERAQDAFSGACNEVMSRRARNGRAMLAAYRAYMLALVRLESETGRLNAYVEADIAALGERLMAALSAFTDARVAREREQARRRLEQWQERLEEARRDVTEAEIQRAVNLVLSGISLVLSCFNLPRAVVIAVGVGGLVVQTLLDTALGPGSPDALAASNTAVGNLGGLPREVRAATSRFSTGVSALVGLHLDTNEVDEARRIVARTAVELNRARRAYIRMMDEMSSQSIQVGLAREMWRRGVERARAAARNVQTSENEHRALMRALESID